MEFSTKEQQIAFTRREFLRLVSEKHKRKETARHKRKRTDDPGDDTEPSSSAVGDARRDEQDDDNTISRQQSIILIKRVGFNVTDGELSDLVSDQDVNADDKVDIDGIISIINHLFDRRPVPVILDTADEQEINRRKNELLKRIRQLINQDVAVDKAMYESLCVQIGLSPDDDT
ncbi:unnamed protein product [Rotaria sp. Silwood2]|nr:unnamed protein product [Rotaria sp. Silwood2]CAF4467450.1 unnamed protein product [Rotaria sp. Silwood2]